MLKNLESVCVWCGMGARWELNSCKAELQSKDKTGRYAGSRSKTRRALQGRVGEETGSPTSSAFPASLV